MSSKQQLTALPKLSMSVAGEKSGGGDDIGGKKMKKKSQGQSSLRLASALGTVLSTTLFVMCDVFHPYAPKFPLVPTLGLCIALHLAVPIFATLLGRKMHGPEHYKYFQPFAGGMTFVGLQAVGALLFIASTAMVLVFSTFIRSQTSGGFTHTLAESQTTTLHGPLALAGVLSFVCSLALHRSIYVFQVMDNTNKSSGNKKGSSGGRSLWESLSTSPNGESAIVILVSLAALVLSLSAPWIPTAYLHPSWLILAMAASHGLPTILSHFVVGWMHTPNYRLFMPFNLGLKAVVAQGTAWTGICLCWMILAGLWGTVNSPNFSTASAIDGGLFGILPFFGLISSGCNIGLLAHIRSTRHKESSARSRTNLASHGPFVCTTAAVCQAAFVLGRHSDPIIFPEIILSWEGLGSCLALTQFSMLLWPVFTHLLGKFVHGEAFDIWKPFYGRPDFVVLQALGWVSFSVACTCDILYLAEGKLEKAWSVAAASAAVVAQILIHTSIRVFTAAPSTSVGANANSGKRKNKSGDTPSYDSGVQKVAADEVDLIHFINGEWMLGAACSFSSFCLLLACDQLRADPDFPLKPIVMVAFILSLMSSPLAQLSGRDKFGLRAMLTPFQGSAEYVSLQAVGWTIFALDLVFFASHGMTLYMNDALSLARYMDGDSASAAATFYTGIAIISQFSFALVSASIYVEVQHLVLWKSEQLQDSGSPSFSPRTGGSSSLFASSSISRGRTSRRSGSPASHHRPRSPASVLGVHTSGGGRSTNNSFADALAATGKSSSSYLELLAGQLSAEEVDEIETFARSRGTGASEKLTTFLRESAVLAREELAQKEQKNLTSGFQTRDSVSPVGSEGENDDEISLLVSEEQEGYAHSVAAAATVVSCVATTGLYLAGALLRWGGQTPQSFVLIMSGLISSSLVTLGNHVLFGPAIYSSKKYKLWQPFAGGSAFVALQACGFGSWGTCLVITLNVIFSPPHGGFTRLFIAGVLGLVSQICLYTSIMKFDPKSTAESKSASFVVKHAEAGVSVLLLIGSGFMGSIHRFSGSGGAEINDISNHSTGTLGAANPLPGANIALLSVAPLFLSFCALAFAVPMGAIAIRKASAENQDLFDDEDNETQSKKRQKRSGILVSLFVVSVRFISPAIIFSLPLMLLYAGYYALMSSEVALAILDTGSILLATALGALGVLALMQVSDDISLAIMANWDYGLPMYGAVGMILWPICRPVASTWLTLANTVAFSLFPYGFRPVMLFINATSIPYFLWSISENIYKECSAAQVGVEENSWAAVIPCLNLDSLYACYCLSEFTITIMINVLYYQTIKSKAEIDGSLYNERFTDFCRRHIFTAKEKYFQAQVINEGPPLPEDTPCMIGYHPHGIIPASCVWIVRSNVWLKAMGKAFVSVHGAAPIFKTPYIRDMPLRLGARLVSKAGIHTSIDQGNSVMLVPGGQAELILSRVSETELALVTRHVGFMRIALQRNMPLIPLVAFGEQDLLDNLHWPAMQKWCLKHCGIAFPVLPMGAFYTPYPSKTRMTFVVGKPVYPPKWYVESVAAETAASQQTPTDAIPKKKRVAEGQPDMKRMVTVSGFSSPISANDRENKAVDEVADIYWEEVKRIFEKHKAAAGYPKMKLTLEGRKRAYEGPSAANVTTTAGGGAAEPSSPKLLSKSRGAKENASSSNNLLKSQSSSKYAPQSREGTAVFDVEEDRSASSLSPSGSKKSFRKKKKD